MSQASLVKQIPENVPSVPEFPRVPENRLAGRSVLHPRLGFQKVNYAAIEGEVREASWCDGKLNRSLIGHGVEYALSLEIKGAPVDSGLIDAGFFDEAGGFGEVPERFCGV